MERWEIIERWVLVVVAAGMLLAIGWCAWTGDSPSRWFGLLFLPLAFWALWQAFFEDNASGIDEPKLPERAMAGSWLVFRRVIAWGMALFFARARAWRMTGRCIRSASGAIGGGFECAERKG